MSSSARGSIDIQILVTVLSGVSVFIFGQIVLKLFIEPVVTLKATFGEISGLFLREQPKIIGAVAKSETREDMFRFASLLLAQKSAIPLYCFTRLLFGLPSEKALVSAACSLNLLGSITNEKALDIAGKNKYKFVLESMKNISNKLKIITDYTTL
ncbi:hypothetical protein EDB69_3142 [Vibrio crassostreae]|uniref:hypothetical protein n=1 Tax=Vibrio crassostreae TaxID=246167 RepID=UPI000F50D017|nr:hypothetical protein [Vibrio crassostreae]ROO70357.1 hypothetical protein EDB64_2861 [Vibrio crassostreae]ROP08713.1 hypothetical protein EDB63_2718 [Vibrio crassostreae]ROQ75426.1 hypothetical protein EDB72_3547 [Vibrio crassostreae]ROR79798.1 hypothetical protein EDB66_2889 [Vibrio crassostreae]RPE91512.1 hypothetical protein EDB68_2722 [Vibrio crassostreae]